MLDSEGKDMAQPVCCSCACIDECNIIVFVLLCHSLESLVGAYLLRGNVVNYMIHILYMCILEYMLLWHSLG